MSPTVGARRSSRALFLTLAALAIPLARDAAAQPGDPNGTWSLIPPLSTPSARKWCGMVFDPVRERTLVIGGYPGPRGDVWALPLAGAPSWTRLLSEGAGPTSRFAHTAIYQPGQDRVILFGGYDGVFRNDVWALSLTGTPAWTQLAPLGTPPAARWAHVAAYDAARDRMIVFGGYDGSVSRNDAWALSLGATPAWTQLTPAGPLPNPRTNIDGVYDGARDQVVVFGGFDTGTQQFFNDVWTLSLAGTGAWAKLLPSGIAPSPRRDHSMIYEAARGRVVVFGGSDPLPRNDTYALTLGPAPAWTPIVAVGTQPSGRSAQRAIYDPPRDRMVIFGGEGVGYLNETWGLALGASPAWTQLTGATPQFPAPRRNFGMASTGGSILFFGGDDGGPRDDTGELTLGAVPAWVPVAPAVRPTARFGHHAVFDAPRNRVLIFGGYDGAYLNDVHAFSQATGSWEPVAASGMPPSGRMYCGLVYDAGRERLLVIGGHPDKLNDVWALRLKGGHPAWSQLSPRGTAPSPRFAHSVIYQPARNRVILFGGFDGLYRNDVWELSLQGAPTWTQLTPAGTPPAGRWAAAVAYDATRDRMVVFGGYDGVVSRNDVWALSLGATPAWTQLAPAGPQPSPRANVEGAYDAAGDRFVVMDGFDTSTQQFFGEAWVLDFGTPASPPAASSTESRLARPGGARLALAGAWPNPAAGGLDIRYSLEDASPATFELFDTAGRRVLGRDVGPMGAGEHDLRIAEAGAWPAGVYFVRLRQHGRSLTSRVILIR